MKTKLIAALLAAFVLTSVHAAPPPNDEFDTATVFPSVRNIGNYPGTIKDATGDDVWYLWTAPAYGPVTVSVTLGGFWPGIEVYRHDPFNHTTTLVARNRVSTLYNSASWSASVAYAGEPGYEYYIRIAMVDTFSYFGPTFELSIQQTLSSLPDSVLDAAFIPTNRVTVQGLNTAATSEPGEPLHAGASNKASVWMYWLPTSRMTVNLDTTGSNFDTVLGVYKQIGYLGLNVPDFTKLEGVASNDNVSNSPFSPQTQSKLSFVAETGTAYYFVVASKTGQTGYVSLDINAIPRKPDIDALPKAIYAKQDAPTTIPISVKGTGAISYKWQRKPAAETAWVDLTVTPPYSGVSTNTLQISNVTPAMNNDQFRCLVTDTVGSTTSRSMNLVVTEFAPLEVTVGGKNAIDLSNNTPPPANTNYYVKGLPKGFTLDPTTGKITADDPITTKPGTYIVTYGTVTTDSSGKKVTGSPKTMVFIISPLSDNQSGAFEAILKHPISNTVVGKVELSVDSKNAAITGKVTYVDDPRSYPVKGRVSLNTMFDVATAQLEIKRTKDLLPYRLDVTLDDTDPNNPAVSAALLQLNASKQVVATLGQSAGGTKVVKYSVASPAPWSGFYSIVLNNPDAPTMNAGLNPAPQGTGYATASVIPGKGVLKLTGKLADGTILTAGLNPASNGTHRLFVKPYKAGGYFGGVLDFDPVAGNAAPYKITTQLDNDFTWGKQPNVKDKSYRAGFGPVLLSAVGQVWTSPLETPLRDSLLNVGNTGDITVSLYSDSLPADDLARLPTQVKMSETNLITVTAPLANLGKYTASTRLRDGVFNAKFTLIDGRKISADGILLQQPSRSEGTVIGEGFFTIPSLVKGEASVTGRIRLSIPVTPPIP